MEQQQPEQQPEQQVEAYVDLGVGSQPDLQGGLERLWAPYRSQYIAKSKRSADPFATLPELSDEEALICLLYTSDAADE